MAQFVVLTNITAEAAARHGKPGLEADGSQKWSASAVLDITKITNMFVIETY
jgi:hypothetical protein